MSILRATRFALIPAVNSAKLQPMGLDSVELVLEVENAFDIKIPDQEAAKIFTVGDFYEVVWRHLEGRHSDKCNSQFLFYRLRNGFVQQFGSRKQDVLLDAPPDQLFPLERRREAYQLLQQRIGLTFPDLKLPDPWSNWWLLTIVCLVLGSLLAEILLINFGGYSSWILLWTALAVFVVFGLSRLLEPYRTYIAEPTMRDFTMQVLTLNYKELTSSTGISRKEMENVIDQIIVNKIGVDTDEVSPEKSLTDDLGVN